MKIKLNFSLTLTTGIGLQSVVARLLVPLKFQFAQMPQSEDGRPGD